ncbi:hypothetical protein KBD33_05975 [Candidatus Gracilibacteria bacterium]|nr:hypothetical protein [Candidatus Gracilibacteria bacterium]
MAGFLPKDYVGVNTRVDQAHEKYKEKLSITTLFDIKDKTVIFTATIKCGDQIFTGHSFGEVGKEKAFEKLETVAVGRALAFAGFETTGGIASREEMEVWEEKSEVRAKYVKDRDWFNEPQYTAFEKVKDTYGTYEEAINGISSKYNINKEMQAKVKILFE